MIVLKCKMCGGDVELSPDKTYGICNYCGNNVKLSETGHEQKVSLKDIADNVASTSLERLIQNSNTYLKLSDYSSAQEVFSRITKEYPEDYRGWWGLIVCETKGFEIIKKDQSSINKWFKYVQQLAPEEAFSIYKSEFETYVREICNVDFENEVVKINGIIGDLNEKIKVFSSEIKQIEQYKELQNKNCYNEILDKNREISAINPFDGHLLRPKKIIINKIFNFIIKTFGIVFIVAGCTGYFLQKETQDFPIAVALIFTYIGSKCFLSYSASLLPVGIILILSQNPSLLGLGIIITFFSSIVTWFSYRKSKKAKDEEAYRIKVKTENIERQKVEIAMQYENNISKLSKQIDKINNHILVLKNTIENCKKYLAYDKDKISDMLFALRCADFGITYQFNNEIKNLREEIIEESNGHIEQVMNSVLHFQNNINLS